MKNSIRNAMYIMEEVYDLRIEHGCILMILLLIVTSLFWGMRQGMLQRLAYTRYCYNQLADNAIEDGLDAGCRFQGGSYPKIDEEVAKNTFISSLCKSFDVTKESEDGKRLMNCVKGIVFLQNDFFSLTTGDKTTRYYYEMEIQGWKLQCSLDGRMIATHSLTGKSVLGDEEEIRRHIGVWEGYEEGENILVQRIIINSIEPVLTSLVQKYAGREGCRIDIPLVKEENTHTLTGVSMLCMMQYDRKYVDGCEMERYALSGARVIANTGKKE